MDDFYLFQISDNDFNLSDQFSVEDFSNDLLIVNCVDSEDNVSVNPLFQEFISQRIKRYKTYTEKSNTALSHVPHYFLEDFCEDNSVVSDELSASQDSYIDILATINERDEYYTGIKVENWKNRYLLCPFKISNKDRFTYCGAILNLYQGIAILHIISWYYDIDIDALSESFNKPKNEKIFLPKFIYGEEKSYDLLWDKSLEIIDDVAEKYISYIQNLFGFKNKRIQADFKHITLLDCSFMQDLLNNHQVNDEYLEPIYKILCAPIKRNTSSSIIRMRKVVDHSFYKETSADSAYLVHSQNRSLCLFSSSLASKADNTMQLYLPSITGILPAIEYVLLKKYVNENVFVFNLKADLNLEELISLKSRYDEFDYRLFSRYFFKFGTLKSLISFMEKNLTDYFNDDLIKNRMNRIEELIKLKNQLKTEKITTVGIYIGIILVIIFSFPTIEQIASYMKIENYSFPIWLILNVISLIMVLIILYWNEKFMSYMRRIKLLFFESYNFIKTRIKKIAHFFKEQFKRIVDFINKRG